jgi:hypothetical protein
VTAVDTSATDELAELQTEYRGRWHIWRSQRNGEPASWCASIRHPAAGVDPTVIADTAEQLRDALVDQRERRESGAVPYDVAAQDHYPV